MDYIQLYIVCAETDRYFDRTFNYFAIRREVYLVGRHGHDEARIAG